jgi:uncharacterized repeat protein (TIGR01451 family)
MAAMRRSVAVLVLVLLSIVGPAVAGVGAAARAAKPASGADMLVGSVGGSPNPVFVNQPVTFSVTVGNLGPAPATDVQVTTQLPAGVRFEPTLSSSTCAESGGVVACSYPTWDVSAFGIVRIAVTPSTVGTLQLTGTVTAAQRDPDPSNNSQTGAVAVVQPVEADVSINLPTAVQGYAGQPMFYFVEVANAGPAPATGLTVTLGFPAGLGPADPTGCTTTDTGLTCSYSFGDLPARSGSITPLLLEPVAAGSYTVSGRVGADQPDPDGSNNTDTGAVEISPAADLSVRIAESTDPTTPGQPLTYTVTVSNAGPSPASAVALLDTVTSTTRRFELLSVTTSQGQCSAAALSIDCQLGTVASGGSVVVAVTVRPSGLGTVSDEARVAAAEFDPNTADNAVSESTVVGSG